MLRCMTPATAQMTFRLDTPLRERLDARSEDTGRSAGDIVRTALLRHLDGEDIAVGLSPGVDSAIRRDGVPCEVAALLRFTVRTDTLMEARQVADRAITLANAKIRSVGADDEIEVVGPWFNRSSLAWAVEQPPPVTLHFVGDSCDRHTHWRFNGITVDGMAGLMQLPEFECSPTTLRLKLPGIDGPPLALGLVDRGHGDPDQWYVDWDGTHSQVLAQIRPAGTWTDPDTGLESGPISGPLGQLGPVRLIDHDTLRETAH